MTQPAQTRHEYGALFYRYQRSGAQQSARLLLPRLLRHLDSRTVLDVGCGAGAWVQSYRELGLERAIGVDGDYVDRSLLLMDPDDFIAQDITRPFDLNCQFDIVQCLEVGEHVPHMASATLVENLVRHGKIVLFSAAPPGQGGEDHINEQPYSYWRDLFLRHGYRLFDAVRPLVRGERGIEPWYRFNVLLFAHDSVVDRLADAVKGCRVPDDARIADVSTPGFRMRKMILRCLPSSTVSRLATLKHRGIVASTRR
jgi:SAM-dependent methyltransferase